ncbi:MAG: VWA domain-containing protein [Thermoanaerobaculia bacterium]
MHAHPGPTQLPGPSRPRSTRRPTLRRGLLGWSALAATLLLAPWLWAQQGGPQGDEEPSDTVFDSIDVQVVNLDVFVTGDDGQPVTGLGREDFRLFVDGREVPIANFYAAPAPPERDAAEPPAPAPEPEPEPRPPEPEEPAEEEPAEETRRRPDEELHLVFFVDNSNLRGPDRNRVLTALERFVSTRVPDGTRMMLVTYDHSLHVRQEFTANPDVLLDAAQEIRGLTGLAATLDSRRRRAVDEIEKASSEGRALLAAEAFADERQLEIERPLDAMVELTEPLGGLPGRKALVHVSNGLPNRIGEELFFLVDERFPRAGAKLRSFLYDMDSTYNRIVRAANTAGVTFYTLDAAGLTTFDSLSAAEPGSVFGGSFAIADSIRRSNLQVPLAKMAEETGGVAVLNSNDVEGLFDRVATDASAYYSLGYQAAPATHGRYRRLRVEVDRPGVRVRHRHGFRVRSIERRLREGVLATLTLGRSEEGFPGAVSAGRPVPHSDSDGVYRVPLVVQVPLEEITLVPGESFWVGRVRLAVQARDRRGDLSGVTIGEPLDVQIPASEIDTALGQHITWSVELLMKPGRHDLAVGLADLVADELEFTMGAVSVEGS